jgi:GAF domain-containing protein
MNSSLSTKQAFAEFSRILQASGVRDALGYLVGLSDYRFIGIFRFQAGMAAAAVHYDKADPSVLRSAEVPDTATYCCFVRDTGGVFTTANALTDARLQGHVAREAVQAYCGVPVMDAEGRLLGTLCHYDVVPRDPDQLDLQLLLQVASALAYGHHVPPYPASDSDAG